MTEETNQPEYGQVETDAPEIQIEHAGSNTVEELVHEMEKKDEINGVDKPVEEKRNLLQILNFLKSLQH